MIKLKKIASHQKYSHKELCNRASQWAINNGNPVVFNELVCMAGEQADVLAFNGDSSTLIEVKTSRSDFLKDNQKWFRKLDTKTLGNYKYYFCVTDVIRPEELPVDWGLIYFDVETGKSRIKIRAKKVEACETWERAYMYSALRRVFAQPALRDTVKYFAKPEAGLDYEPQTEEVFFKYKMSGIIDGPVLQKPPGDCYESRE